MKQVGRDTTQCSQASPWQQRIPHVHIPAVEADTARLSSLVSEVGADGTPCEAGTHCCCPPIPRPPFFSSRTQQSQLGADTRPDYTRWHPLCVG